MLTATPHTGSSGRNLAVAITIAILLHAGLLVWWSEQYEIPSFRQDGWPLSIAILKAEPAKPFAMPAQAPVHETRKRAEVPPAAQTPEARPERQTVAVSTPRPHPATAQQIVKEPAPLPQESSIASHAAEPNNTPVASRPVNYRQQVIGLLQTEFARHFKYPLLARKRGWQGVVLLDFHLQANGRVGNIRVAKSSGYALLDQAALESLQAVSYIEGIVSWLDNSGLDLQLPVNYRLNEG